MMAIATYMFILGGQLPSAKPPSPLAIAMNGAIRSGQHLRQRELPVRVRYRLHLSKA